MAQLAGRSTEAAEVDGCVYVWLSEQVKAGAIESYRESIQESARQQWQSRLSRSCMAFNDEFEVLDYFVNDHLLRNSNEVVQVRPEGSSRIHFVVLEARSRRQIVAAVESGLCLPHWIVRVSASKFQVGWWVMRTNKQMEMLRRRSGNAGRAAPVSDEVADRLDWANAFNRMRDPFHVDAELEFFSFVHGYVYGVETLTRVDTSRYRSELVISAGKSGGAKRSAKKSQANRVNSSRGVEARRRLRDQRREAIQAIVNESEVYSAQQFCAMLAPKFDVSVHTVRRDLRAMGLNG